MELSIGWMNSLTLIWVGLLGVRFEVGCVCKIYASYARNLKFGT